MRRLLDQLRKWLLQRWWGRNLANIISITGSVVAYWILFYANWSVFYRLMGFVATAPLDWLDGIVARWLGMDKGVGQVIDPVADKVKNFSAIVFLFKHTEPVLRWAIGIILAGEIAVLIPVGYASYMEFARERNRKKLQLKSGGLSWWECIKRIPESYKCILKNTRENIMENWRVSQEGKITMLCYGLMFGFILPRTKYMEEEIFIWICVSLAAIGFSYRIVSLRGYWNKFNDWQGKFFANETGAG